MPSRARLTLGAGVLILWYGGTIAMRTDGSITVSHAPAAAA